MRLRDRRERRRCLWRSLAFGRVVEDIQDGQELSLPVDYPSRITDGGGVVARRSLALKTSHHSAQTIAIATISQKRSAPPGRRSRLAAGCGLAGFDGAAGDGHQDFGTAPSQSRLGRGRAGSEIRHGAQGCSLPVRLGPEFSPGGPVLRKLFLPATLRSGTAPRSCRVPAPVARSLSARL